MPDAELISARVPGGTCLIRFKTMKHIATARTIPSFRSSGSAIRGWMDVTRDRARIASDRAQILAQEVRRQWLNLADLRQAGRPH